MAPPQESGLRAEPMPAHSRASGRFTTGAPSGLSVSNRYDQYLRRTNVTVRDGSTNLAATGCSYDAASRKIAETNANGEVTRFAYDASGNLTNLVDGKSQNTYWRYDTYGRVTNKTDQSGTTLFGYSYDANDRLLNRASAAKGTTVYAYDRLGNLTNISHPSSTSITLRYDKLSRPTNRVDAAGTTGYSCDVAGQMLTEDGPWDNDTVSYTYANRLRSTMSLAAPSGGSAYSFSYAQSDNLNELTTVTRTGTFTVGGATTQATNVTVSGLSSYLCLTFASSNHTLVDGSNTFTAIARSTAGDWATNTTVAYLPTTTTFAYDANGNLTNDGRRAFFYDDENQLVRVIVTNGVGSSTRSDFVYDGKMRRRARIECTWSGSTWMTNNIVRYVYDGNLVLQERWLTPSLSASTVQQQVTYTRGRDLSGSMEGAGGIGGLLARTALTNSQAATSYYHGDGNGNVTCLVNSNQLVVASYAYDPFGTILRQSGPMADGNLYRFSSKEWHENSGMIYYLYRFYDPSLQRWVNRDPVGEDGGLNLYAYCLNSPLSFYDADGLLGTPAENLALILAIGAEEAAEILGISVEAAKAIALAGATIGSKCDTKAWHHERPNPDKTKKRGDHKNRPDGKRDRDPQPKPPEKPPQPPPTPPFDGPPKDGGPPRPRPGR